MRVFTGFQNPSKILKETGKKKKKMRTLTLKEKVDIIQEVESNPTKKRSKNAQEHKIPRSTLSNILTNKDKYERLLSSGKVSNQQSRASTNCITPIMYLCFENYTSYWSFI